MNDRRPWPPNTRPSCLPSLPTRMVERAATVREGRDMGELPARRGCSCARSWRAAAQVAAAHLGATGSPPNRPPVRRLIDRRAARRAGGLPGSAREFHGRISAWIPLRPGADPAAGDRAAGAIWRRRSGCLGAAPPSGRHRLALAVTPCWRSGGVVVVSRVMALGAGRQCALTIARDNAALSALEVCFIPATGLPPSVRSVLISSSPCPTSEMPTTRISKATALRAAGAQAQRAGRPRRIARRAGTLWCPAGCCWSTVTTRPPVGARAEVGPLRRWSWPATWPASSGAPWAGRWPERIWTRGQRRA